MTKKQHPMRFFRYYGDLEWIWRKDYMAGKWSYVASARDDDGRIWDIVENDVTGEMRYTRI